MGYWQRLGQEISDIISENRKFLNEIYERDVLSFTGIILIFVSGVIMVSLMILFGLLTSLKIIPIYPPNPVYNGNLFMGLTFVFFVPLMFGVFLIIGRHPSTKKKIETKDHEKILPEVKFDNLSLVNKNNFENFALSESDFNLIVKQLERKNVKSICPMCGFETLNLSRFFGFSKHYIRASDFIETNDGIPTVIIACQRCGFLMEHALAPLELTNVKKSLSETMSQEENKDV